MVKCDWTIPLERRLEMLGDMTDAGGDRLPASMCDAEIIRIH